MNTNFYSLWFDPTGNRTRVYRFSSRRSIHSTTDQYNLFITDVYYRSAADMENSKHCYIAIGLLYLSNQEKKAKFAEVKSRLRKCKKLPQTFGFAVADHPLLFCGCGIGFKSAVPSTRQDCSRDSTIFL